MKILRLAVKNIGYLFLLLFSIGAVFGYFVAEVKPQDLANTGFTYQQGRIFQSFVVGLVLPALLIPTALVLKTCFESNIIFPSDE